MKVLMLVLFSFISPAMAEERGSLQLQYKPGDGLKVGDGNNLISLQARVQGRFTYNALENAADNDTFAIQRGKIKIEGHTMEKELKFYFQTNLATRANNTTGLAILEDYYVDYVPEKIFGIRVGQFKVPFLIQELTSSGKQQFVDRSLSTGFFNLARDIGASLHGDLWDHGLNYWLFAMNGDGVNTVNANQSIMVGTRFEYPIFGDYLPSESDTDHSPEPNLGMGLAMAYNEVGNAMQAGTIAGGTKIITGTFDAGYKFEGLSAQISAMATKALDTAVLTNWGYNAQVGYFLVPKKFEVAGRGAGAIFDAATPHQYEYALALNYFVLGHGFKFQTDYAFLMNNRGINLNDHRVRNQLQVIF